MSLIERSVYKSIKNWLFKGQVVIIYGPRQVGKTTLVKQIQTEFSQDSLYLNCDEIDVRANLSKESSTALKSYIGEPKLLIIDEAQRISNVGLVLKLIHDNFPQIQVIATGSSSFDLANKINEPLTGRSITFTLFPLSLSEISSLYNRPQLFELKNNLMRFGAYPGVRSLSDLEKPIFLDNLQNNYLFKDLFNLGNILKPDILTKLLKLLAFQIGQVVSINELSVSLGVDNKTVERYLDLLKKTFIITELGSFSTNQRNEVNRAKKYYFNDLGIRNSLIENYNSLDLRNDIGALWENFLVMERIKYWQSTGQNTKGYFWRNYNKNEVDYIETVGGEIKAWEFKWSENKKIKMPKDFLNRYNVDKIELINSANFLDFVGVR